MKLNKNKYKPVCCPTAKIIEQYQKHLFMKALWEEEIENNPYLLDLMPAPHFFIIKQGL